MNYAKALSSKKDLREPFRHFLQVLKDDNFIQVKNVTDLAINLTYSDTSYILTYNVFECDWKIAYANNIIHQIIKNDNMNRDMLIQVLRTLGVMRYERLQSERTKIHDYLDICGIANIRNEASYDVFINSNFMFKMNKMTLKWSLHYRTWIGLSYSCDDLLKCNINEMMDKLIDADYEYNYGYIV
jgi:hypothetical protein